MSVTVNLMSGKEGEIKSFLESYYGKCLDMENDIEHWIYVYRKPLDAVDLISAVIDNKDRYHISMCLQLNEGELHPVTAENHNDIIKGLFSLFYEEAPFIENSVSLY